MVVDDVRLDDGLLVWLRSEEYVIEGLGVCVSVLVRIVLNVIDALTDGVCDGLPDIDGEPESEYVLVCTFV